MQNLSTWLKNNKLELALLLAILLVATFLRFYKLAGYMTFLGDEGRDVLIVRRLLVEGDLILIGPGTSIGNMYLGPLYYYLIAPALLLANFSPVGPVALVAGLGVATVYLVWKATREFFGKFAGLFAAGLYAVSPTTIIFSRSSWNPNIMPFAALLSVYSLWKAVSSKNYYWLVVTAVAYAFVLQSHYLGIFLLPVLFFIWLPQFLQAETKASFLRFSVLSLLVFAFLVSPLLIFDLRHDFLNFKALTAFLKQNDSLAVSPQRVAMNFWRILQLVTTRLLAGRNLIFANWILAVITLPSILLVANRKNLGKNETAGYSILLFWLLVGILGLTFYKGEIYDHYFTFLFPIPFMILGAFTKGIAANLNRRGLIILSLSFFVLVAINLLDNPLRYPPNNQLERSKVVAEKILLEAAGEPFNIAVLAERNYEDGYIYFLEKEGVKPLHADVWDETTISETLFVVCERPRQECKPTTDPKAEIANFGMSQIEEEWEVGGVVLYRLTHTK